MATRKAKAVETYWGRVGTPVLVEKQSDKNFYLFDNRWVKLPAIAISNTEKVDFDNVDLEEVQLWARRMEATYGQTYTDLRVIMEEVQDLYKEGYPRQWYLYGRRPFTEIETKLRAELAEKARVEDEARARKEHAALTKKLEELDKKKAALERKMKKNATSA